ncbi:expressed unknown protein [Seminavis robusta]|uniref:Uncharacterized protein n=1 Tax=Seminavis robusta TaxID=568900 RepID=A0A9N8E938_9STRA|nr:expressed unknown protein [Seminavis robusta]|eukprot:Sro759_g198280.1 n/a (143) ;mRNA; f:39492-39920
MAFSDLLSHDDHDTMAKTTIVPFLSVYEIRILESAAERAMENNETTTIPETSSTSPPSDGVKQEMKQDPLWMVIYIAVGVWIAYMLYRCFRFWLRRRRILRSENAMGHLGDLQMLPQSEDFTDAPNQDEGDVEIDESENELL